VNWRSADKRAGQGLMLWLSQQNAEIPGTLRKAAVEQDGRQANFLNRRGRFERNVDTATLAHSGQWRNRQWTIDSTLYATGRWLDSPVTTVISTDGVDTGLRLKGERLGTRGILTVGGNIAHGRADEQRWRNNLGTPGAPVLTRTLGAVSAEGFAQYQYSLTRSVDVLAGVQGLYASRTLEDSTPVLQRQDSRYYALNPRVGILYNLGTAQWFTNLSRSAEPPTWNELSGGNEPGFTPLGLQTAVTVETGLRGKWQEGWRWELALWRSCLRDELFTFRFPDGRFPDGRTVTANALKTRKQGVELGVEGRVLPSLTVKLAYILQQGNFVDDALYGDNTLPGLPEHVVQAAVAYTPVAGFILTPRVEWVPLGYPVDNTGTLDTDGYALAGLQAEWVVTSGFTVFADARNLFDSPYIATTNIIPDAGGADQSQFFPGEGRAVYAGVVWRW
jgi:iron complex outermembrane receptor protein